MNRAPCKLAEMEKERKQPFEVFPFATRQMKTCKELASLGDENFELRPLINCFSAVSRRNKARLPLHLIGIYFISFCLQCWCDLMFMSVPLTTRTRPGYNGGEEVLFHSTLSPQTIYFLLFFFYTYLLLNKV